MYKCVNLKSTILNKRNKLNITILLNKKKFIS
jgi:hypothetical protein